MVYDTWEADLFCPVFMDMLLLMHKGLARQLNFPLFVWLWGMRRVHGVMHTELNFPLFVWLWGMRRVHGVMHTVLSGV